VLKRPKEEKGKINTFDETDFLIPSKRKPLFIAFKPSWPLFFLPFLYTIQKLLPKKYLRYLSFIPEENV
jgi:hypothetical protein